MDVIPRKLQRLGLSSLVVTLPHRWVKAHNLKPGDLVYVIDEGDRLRIFPARGESRHTGYVFEAHKLGIPQLAQMALTCLYVNNFNEVDIDFRGMGQETLQRMKQAAVRLLGLELVQVDAERATMRVVLDDAKADPKLAVKGLGSAVANIAELIRRASSGDEVTDEEVDLAMTDLMRYQHLIMRYVIGSIAEGLVDPKAQSVMIGTAVLGVVGNTLMEALKLLRSWSLKSNGIAQVASQLKDLTPVVGAMVAQPSVKRLHEVSFSAIALSMMIESMLKSASDPRETAVLSKIDDAVKSLLITFTAVLCSAILGEEFLHPSQ